MAQDDEQVHALRRAIQLLETANEPRLRPVIELLERKLHAAEQRPE